MTNPTSSYVLSSLPWTIPAIPVAGTLVVLTVVNGVVVHDPLFAIHQDHIEFNVSSTSSTAFKVR
jgi:hypothetical protein